MKMSFNRHAKDFGENTLEFEVKNPNYDKLPEDIFDYELETGSFRDYYTEKCFKKIMRVKYSWIKDWSFAGRMGGWFVLLINKKPEEIQQRTIDRIEMIIKDYFNNFNRELLKYYNVKNIK